MFLSGVPEIGCNTINITASTAHCNPNDAGLQKKSSIALLILFGFLLRMLLLLFRHKKPLVVEANSIVDENLNSEN